MREEAAAKGVADRDLVLSARRGPVEGRRDRDRRRRLRRADRGAARRAHHQGQALDRPPRAGRGEEGLREARDRRRDPGGAGARTACRRPSAGGGSWCSRAARPRARTRSTTTPARSATAAATARSSAATPSSARARTRWRCSTGWSRSTRAATEPRSIAIGGFPCAAISAMLAGRQERAQQAAMYPESEPRRGGFGGAVFAVIVIALMCYLTFAALQGEHGLFRLFQVEAQEKRLRDRARRAAGRARGDRQQDAAALDRAPRPRPARRAGAQGARPRPRRTRSSSAERRPAGAPRAIQGFHPPIAGYN